MPMSATAEYQHFAGAGSSDRRQGVNFQPVLTG